MRIMTLPSILIHLAIGIVATAILFAVLFATGLLNYDGAMVQTGPVFVSTTIGPTPDDIIISSRFFSVHPGTALVLAVILSGLTAGLSYGLFTRATRS